MGNKKGQKHGWINTSFYKLGSIRSAKYIFYIDKKDNESNR